MSDTASKTVSIRQVPVEKPWSIEELTEAKVDGSGVLDVLLTTMREHLELEFQQNRIRGNDYATVYLGAFTAVLQQAIAYTLAKSKLAYELDLLEAQKAYSDAQTENLKLQTEKIPLEIELLKKQRCIAEEQILTSRAQRLQTGAQTTQIEAQTVNVRKQGAVIDAQADQTHRQTSLIQTQIDRAPLEDNHLKAQTEHVNKQSALVQKQIEIAEPELELKREQVKIAQKQLELTEKEIPLKEAQTKVAEEQVKATVAQTQATIAQTDVIKMKAPSEIMATEAQARLYKQKVETEVAQIDGAQIKPGSVLWNQNHLIEEQAKGFERVALQENAKLLISTWLTRRTTDDDTPADNLNLLNDATIGEAIKRLLENMNTKAKKVIDPEFPDKAVTITDA